MAKASLTIFGQTVELEYDDTLEPVLKQVLQNQHPGEGTDKELCQEQLAGLLKRVAGVVERTQTAAAEEAKKVAEKAAVDKAEEDFNATVLQIKESVADKVAAVTWS